MAQQAKEDDLALCIGAELQGQMALALGQARVVEDLDHPGAARSQRRMDTATRCCQLFRFLEMDECVPQTEGGAEALFSQRFVEADEIAGDEASAGAGGARARLLELRLGAIHAEDAVAGASEVQRMLAGAAAQIEEARLGSFLQHLQQEGAFPLQALGPGEEPAVLQLGVRVRGFWYLWSSVAQAGSREGGDHGTRAAARVMLYFPGAAGARRRSMGKRLQAGAGFMGAGLASLLFLLPACEDTQTFARVERRTLTVDSFQRRPVDGGTRVEVFVSVPEKDHPEILVNWTNLRGEIEVEAYVLARSVYADPANAGKPLAVLAQEQTDLQNQEREDAKQNQQPPPPLRILWPQLPDEQPPYGETRPTQLHLHPDPGEWVVVFYNPFGPGPTNRASLSASIELSFYSIP